jgi:GT2 family glycosyltransferase
MVNRDDSELPHVGAIVLNWNNYEDTFKCIRSLQDLSYKNIDIIVVDNGSDDGSVDKLLNDFSNINLVENTKNLGFSGGMNSGIDKAESIGVDYIWLLNNDVYWNDSDLLDRFISVFERSPNVGALSPKIVTQEGDIWFEKGLVNEKIVATTHRRSYRRVLHGDLEVHTSDEDRLICNDYIPFCCILFRADVIAEIGLLDEDYFLYYEDVDYCIKMKNSGYQLKTAPDIVVTHMVSASSSSYTRPYYTSRNRIHLARKIQEKSPIKFIFYYIIWLIASVVYNIYRKRLKRAKYYLKGAFDGLKNKKGKLPD